MPILPELASAGTCCARMGAEGCGRVAALQASCCTSRIDNGREHAYYLESVLLVGIMALGALMAKKLLMLVPEDDELVELLKLVLGEMRVRIVSSGDPQKAARQLKSIKVDLLLVDTTHPGMLEVVRQLKATPDTKDIPLVALAYPESYYPQQEGRAALGAGADDVLFKPFDLDYLEAKLSNYLLRAAHAR